MQRPSPQEVEHAHVLEDGDRRQLMGIRLQKWGSWVSEIRMTKSREKLWLGCENGERSIRNSNAQVSREVMARLRKWESWVLEIRMPKSREKLWLRSYPTAQHAARAYDASVYCLRGPNAKFNFPNSVPHFPSASSLSRRQIQVAAAKYALDKLPSSPPTLQEKENAREDAPSPSRSVSVSEAELRSKCQQIMEKDALDLWECGSDSRDSCHTLNLERMPSIDDALAMELNSCVWREQQQQEEEHANIIVHPTELWNF